MENKINNMTGGSYTYGSIEHFNNEKDIKVKLEIARKSGASRPWFKGNVVGNEFRGWCPYCKTIHVFTIETAGNIPDCIKEQRWRDIFGSPCGWTLNLFDDEELEKLGLMKKVIKNKKNKESL